MTSCLDPAYWLRLAPGMHIDDAAYIAPARCLDAPAELVEQLRGDLRREGYFQLPPLAWYVEMDRAAGAVGAVSHAGWQPPFAFVYDELWIVFMQLNRLLSALLGPGFLRLPDFWAWYVNPQNAESGWGPHRDKDRRALLPDGTPKTLTIWVSLTDASPLNGCIYIVPADRDPTYNTPDERHYRFPLQAIRALPTAAGAVLGWNAAVAHWGGASTARPSSPRVSLALEFQRGDASPFNEPLTRPDELPSFTSRLRLIVKQIFQYQHMYPLDPATHRLMTGVQEAVSSMGSIVDGDRREPEVPVR